MAKTQKSKAPIAPKRAQAAKKAAPVKKKTQAVSVKKSAPAKKAAPAKKSAVKAAAPAQASSKGKPIKKAAAPAAPSAPASQKSMSALSHHTKDSDKDKSKKTTTIVRSPAAVDAKKAGAKGAATGAAQHSAASSASSNVGTHAGAEHAKDASAGARKSEKSPDKQSGKASEKEKSESEPGAEAFEAMAEEKPVAEPKARARKAKEESSVFENEEEPAEVVLTDADGRRYCRVKDCDQLSTVDNYCRYHYLLFWKNIQVRKKILSEGKLERYIEELTARYPDKYLDMLRKDLRNEKDFLAAIQELEIDEANVDNEYEDEAQSYLEEVRGMSGETSAREEEDF
jgi:hypothetical protein